MMYANKMAVAIKTNGCVLREHKDTVFVKFGTEYSILIKNLNTVRALVHVYIDGESMLPDGLVLNAGQEIDLERSIKNGNLNEGNRFKFIERTGKIEQHRGVKLEDGLIRIEYQFELQRPIINIRDNFRYTGIGGSSTGDYYGSMPGTWFDNNNTTNISYSTNSPLRSKGMTVGPAGAGDIFINQIASGSTMDSYVPQNETGITVPGSKSEQKFGTTTMGALDPQKYSIVLKILGETPDNEPIRKPITTKYKPKCVTCGKQNKATAKFCTECGTALEIFV